MHPSGSHSVGHIRKLFGIFGVASLSMIFFACNSSSKVEADTSPDGKNESPQKITEKSANPHEEFILDKKWEGTHPRLYFSEADLQELIKIYRSNEAEFAQYLPKPDGKEMTAVPGPFVWEGWDERRQNTLPTWAGTEAKAISTLASAYRLTGDAKYLERIKAWLAPLPETLPIKMPKLFTGNRDLSTGYLLLGLAFSYDLLKGHAPADVEGPLRQALITQASQAFADLSSLKEFPYEQNHFFIPLNALLVASAALVDELPEAKTWGTWALEKNKKTLEALTIDGWYHEGFSYWNFSLYYPSASAIALKRTMGINFFQRPPFKDMDLYLSHIALPKPGFFFDFADFGPRVEPDGKGFQKGYDAPWHTTTSTVDLFIPYFAWKEQGSALMQNFLVSIGKYTTYPAGFGPFINLGLPKEKPDASKLPPPYHYFSDVEVVHWRNAWNDPDATAIAFKSGPPVGHHFAEFMRENPDLKSAMGHPHPDAGSFLIFAKGVFLANDTQYTLKRAADHNTILIDGVGQHKDNSPWSMFDQKRSGKSYGDYDKIRMENVWLDRSVMASTAVYGAAYADEHQMKKMDRHLIMIDGRFMVVLDDLQAALPHEYRWLLHTDQPAEKINDNLFAMTNGPARLVIQNLESVKDSIVEPTIVETELYDMSRTRPQQRGFHLALNSLKKEQVKFLTAFCIQASSENAANFKAEVQEGNRIVLSDGENTCVVWIGNGGGLEGQFAYLLTKKGGSTSEVGLYGKKLDYKNIHLSSSQEEKQIKQVPTP